MSGEHPWMPWYPADWLIDPAVRAMKRHARSMYFDLLCHEWMHGPLPDDVSAIARILGEDRRTVAAVWSSIRARFELESTANRSRIDGESKPNLVHIRLESERNRARIKSDLSSKAANIRHHGHANAYAEPMRTGIADAMPSQSQSDPQSEEIQKKPGETLVQTAAASPPLTDAASEPLKLVSRLDFAAAYGAYPRKEGKAKGLAKCKAKIRSPEDLERFERAVGNYAAHVAAEGKEQRFVMLFSTFAEGRWLDWVEPPAVEARAGPPANAPRVATQWREPMPAAPVTRRIKL